MTSGNHESMWERWEEVDGLLERVLDRPLDEREAFLAEACGDDTELLRTVRRLAELSRRSEDERMGPGAGLLLAAFSPAPGTRPGNPEALVGTSVGPYRLGRVLGVGGMGAVYLGERVDGAFERQVAIKVLRRELDAHGVMERFRLERRILASLNHGAIAQLIDGGITEDGRPAFVMEYVDGRPIDQYADERQLGVEERIRLVLRVAEAVEYAHRHLVVHRDIKPSNILVTRDGAVKLLDFGTAKILEGPGPDGVPLATRPDARFVTPEYAAPEQLLGEGVSTQTDVYALAGLLYELLTGIRPYSRRGAETVLDRMIRGDEPTAPSSVVLTVGTPTRAEGGGEGLAGVGAATLPVMTGRALRRRLSGDIDAILLRALRTRPEERYESVAALRDDLQRHLSARPVSARGNAVSYRARRFVRRHRNLVVTASGVLLLLAGSAVGLGLQRRAVLAERNRARAAAHTATRRAEAARQVTAFLVDLFEGSDPLQAKGDTTTVRTILERGRERIQSELVDQPAIRAELLETLGQVYTNLGSFEDAIQLHEHAVALRRDSIAGRPGGLATSLFLLGEAYRAAREFGPAIGAYRAAIDEASAGGDDPVLADARIGLGSAFLLSEHVDSAEVELRLGLEAAARLGRTGDASYLGAQGSLAGVLRRRGDIAGAAELYTQIIDAQRRSPRLNPALFATTLNNLAIVRRMQGNLRDSRALYGEAYDTLTRVLGPGHPESLLVSGNMARVAHELGLTDESERIYRERVVAARERWPDGHWRTADVLMNLGAELVHDGRAGEAVGPLAEAVDLAMTQIGPRHSWTNVYRGWLGTAAALSGRSAEARQLFAWSLDGLSQYEDLADDRQVKGMVRSLVEVMEEQGLSEEAARYRGLVDPSGAAR